MSALSPLLVAAGACYNGGGATIFRSCALHPIECGETTYRSSRWLETNDPSRATECATRESLRDLPKSLGRCDADSERYVCTSHSSACSDSSTFVPKDPSCTVEYDFRPESYFSEAHYGECRGSTTGSNTENGEDSFCAWQFDECPDGSDLSEFLAAPSAGGTGTPRCRCDGVKTGACIYSSEDYFCAVSEAVCDAEPGYSYIDVQQVATLNAECRLCDALPPPPTVRYAKAGACVVGVSFGRKGILDRCALLPSDCQGLGELFFTPNAITNPNVLTPDEADVCLTDEGVRSASVGRCDTIKGDGVKTGACIYSSEDYFCAVSEAMCDAEPGYSFIDVRQVATLGVECRLCDAILPASPLPPGPPPVMPSPPVPSPKSPGSSEIPLVSGGGGGGGGDDVPPPVTTTSEEEEDTSFAAGTVVGIVVGSLVGWVGLLLLATGIKKWATKRRTTDPSQQPEGDGLTLSVENLPAIL